MLRPALIAIFAFTTAAHAQTPPAPDTTYKAECATLIQQWSVIVTGRLDEPQRLARTHNEQGIRLHHFASRSGVRGQHYLACVTYAYAAATYYAEEGADPHKAQNDAQNAMRFAEIEQHLADHIANPAEKLFDHTFAITHAAGKVKPADQNPIELPPQLPSSPSTIATPATTSSQPKTR